jgi:hypothetical protein
MEFDKEHDEIIQLTHELNSVNIQCMRLKKAYDEAYANWKEYISKKETIKKQIKKLTEIIEAGSILKYVENIEGIDTLTNEELTAIYTGIDKTDYNEDSYLKSSGKVYARFIDLERVVKMTIDIKKKYPGWILDSLKWSCSEDSLPPRNYYSSKYITPHGHTVTL